MKQDIYKKHKIVSRITSILILMMVSSCDKVLNEVPDDRTEIDSAEKIGELLTGAYPEGAYVPFLEPRTDNAKDKGRAAEDTRINKESYYWNDLFEPDSDYPSNYWNKAYAAIAKANQALVSIEELRNSGVEENLDAYEGEALLSRAYAHFMLVNIWAKPYNEITSNVDLGVPYATEPESVLIKEYERATVEEVYKNIVNDIEKGIPLIENNYKVPTFHFSKEAAWGFASRVYLHLGKWKKVIEYSDKTLSASFRNKLRNWAGYQNQELTYSQYNTLYSSSVEPANLLLVSAESSYARNFAGARYQLDTSLRDELFSSNNPLGKPWAYPVFGGTDLFLNIPKYLEYFRVTNAAAGIGFSFVQYVLLSNDEVLLNRIEAKVMLNDFEGAMEDINTYLSVKTRFYDQENDAMAVNDFVSFYQDAAYEYKPFYSLTPKQATFIHGILELRRREFYEEGLRWFDIRRYNLEIEHYDKENRETFTLKSGDLKYALQIPNEAVAFGLEPNPR